MQTSIYKSTSFRDLFFNFHSNGGDTRGCVLFLHGGALLIGSKDDLAANIITFLINEGFAVATFDYRSLLECSVAEILQDVRDAIKYTKELVDIPLYTAGYSAGAYLCLLNGALGERVDGIIAFAGYGNLNARWYHEPSQFFIDYKDVSWVSQKLADKAAFDTVEKKIDLYVYLRQEGLWPKYALGSEELDQKGKEFSPINLLASSYPKTVLIHGNQDTDIPYAAALEMETALKEKGVEHKCIILDGFDHDAYVQIVDTKVKTAWEEGLGFIAG